MKRFSAILLCLCMLLSVCPVMAAEYVKDDDSIIYISFDEELPEGSVGYNLELSEDGIYGKSAVFNGTNSYIQLPDNMTAGVTDFTMATWIKPTTSTAAWRRIFDLGNGTETYTFLGMPWSATDVRGAMKINGGSEWNLTATGAIQNGEWSHVAFVQEGTVGKIYVNGVLSAEGTVNMPATLDGMGTTQKNYVGRSQFSGDAYLSAYLDEIVIAKRAMSAEEIYLLGTIQLSEEDVLAAVDIPSKESVKENITLVSEVDGNKVTWASSDESIVYPYDIENGDYVIPAGKVTRPEADTKVTLTATIDFDGKMLTKTIDVNVKAKPAPVGETEAYLYVYFRGNVNGEPENLAIHLAGSEDGYAWFDLNGNHPILKSTMGTKSLRDPYLLRSKNGDRFYLIATDLNTQDGQGWAAWSERGSKYLMVWESDDLVNWSEQRMIKFADENIGCAWAPEATWDPDTEEYLVYASGKDLTMESPADTVYVVRTRDFRTFSEPEYFVAPVDANGNRIWAIDSNIIQADDGKFYHFYKENNGYIQMMVSDHASGPYELVSGFQTIGGEGPGSFKVKGTEDTYALLVDNYSVYVPYITTDIASGQFTQGSGTIIMPTGSKHGGFLPVNAEEYARVLEKWDNPTPDVEGTAARYTYDFEEDSSAYLKGNAQVAFNEERQSNTLVLDGVNSYFEFPEGIFDKRSDFTLSFDVINDNSASNSMTFAAGTGDEHYIFYKTVDTEMRSAITITSWEYEEKAISQNLGDIADKWMHIDFVVTPTSMTIYKDGVQVAVNDSVTKSVYHLAEEGLMAYMGKSMYDADPYFKGEMDNTELYYRALTPGEIAEKNGTDADDMAKLDAEAVTFGRDVNYVTGDITLPSEGVYGSSITWTSDNENVIGLDGKVAVPEEGEVKVTLTGTFNYNGNEFIKEYVLTVKPVTSYMESKLESKWYTYDIKKADSMVTYKFNLKPEQINIDAGIAFADSDVTPSAYGHLAMFVRATTGGYFDVYNASTYAKTDTVYYEAGEVYPFTIEADIVNKTYSVYTEVDGVRKTIADNFKFRQSATCDDIGKVMVYAGNGASTEGLLKVTDFEVILPEEIAFENMAVEGNKLTGNIKSEKALGESALIIIEYTNDGDMKSARIVTVDVKEGDNAIEETVGSDKVKVTLWNSKEIMIPYTEAVVVE